MRSSVASKPSLDKLTGPVGPSPGGSPRVPHRPPGLSPTARKICEILKVEGEKCLKVRSLLSIHVAGAKTRGTGRRPAFRYLSLSGGQWRRLRDLLSLSLNLFRKQEGVPRSCGHNPCGPSHKGCDHKNGTPS